jgi:DNA-binding MarR family transcriptional regulator
MSQSTPSPEPSSPFARPSEAVVFLRLERLCQEAGGRYLLPMPKLARICGLSVGTTNRAVLGLSRRGLIRYQRGYNQARPSLFEVSPEGRAKCADDAAAQLKISPPPTNDNVNHDLLLEFIYRYDKGVFPKQNGQSTSVPLDLGGQFINWIADKLDDLKNLALYRSYCQKFSAVLILNAFQKAMATPQSKIRVSRGALFNFLVKHYARKQQNNPSAGHQAREETDGNSRPL